MLMDYSTLYCSCDVTCVVYDDCCPGFQIDCPAEYNKAMDISSAYAGKLQSTCQKYEENFRSTRFVTSCPANRHACNTTDSPFDEIPVTDEETGVHFVNGKCAACNGVSKGKVWESTVYCASDENSTMTANVSTGNGTETTLSRETLLDLVYRGRCSLKVDFPFRIELRTCQDYTARCRDCQNPELVHACEQGFTQIVHFRFWEDFKNIYCAMCNVPGDGVFCGHGVFVHVGSGHYDKYSLALLFDFNPVKQSAVSLRQDPVDCNIGSEWLGVEIGCRTIECAPDYELAENTCVLKLQYLTLNIEINIYLPSTDVKATENIDAFDSLVASVSANYMEKMISGTIIYEQFETATNSTVNENDFQVDIRIVLKHTPFEFNNITGSDVVNALNLKSLEHILRKEAAGWLRNHSSSFILNIEISLTNASLDESKFLCSRIRFSENEYVEYENKSVQILNKHMVSVGEYIKVNSDIFVCKEHLNYSNEHFQTYTPALNTITGKLTLSLMSISSVCLLIRIVLQPVVPAYSNFPMKLQLNLCISMLTAFLLFLISPLLSEFHLVCKIIAILVHWSFLSMFCWINIISRDILIRFKGFSNKQQEPPKGKTLLKCILLAWGIPLCWVVVAVVVDNVSVNPTFQPQYGDPNCWMNQSWAVIIFFGIPFGISLTVSVCLFITTTFNLRKTFADTKNILNKESNGQEYKIYVKLLILMGITWIFAFIAPYVDHISVWIIFIGLNASQGLFIFVAFVCNKKVVVSLKQCSAGQGKNSTGSSAPQKYTTSTILTNVTSLSMTPQSSPMITSRQTHKK